MKILEIKDKLPIKVKLNNSFYLDGSFDSGTILLIKEIKLNFNNCYKILVTALKEDLEHNRKVATLEWLNKKTGEYDVSYYEYNTPNSNGDYDDVIFVMEDDDCFDLVDSVTENERKIAIEFAEWINSKMEWNFENEFKSVKELFEQFLKERE